MGPYLGDYKEDSTVYFCWDTNDKNGGSITRATNGTIRIYRNGDSSEYTTGITDVEDFDGLTGIHNCMIDLTVGGSLYTPGYDYSVVLSGATIDGETVNAVLATFSIENRMASSELYEKAAKVLVNKAVQNKETGQITYYDDNGTSVILTLTPTETETTITRTPD